MTKNDIKKALYKESPKADLLLPLNKDGIRYQAFLQSGFIVYFTVPFNDIGDGIFHKEMEAKLLNRYLSGF